MRVGNRLIISLGLLAMMVLTAVCRSSQTQPDQSAPAEENRNGEMGRGMMDRMPDWMMNGQMMDSEMMRDMGPIHELLTQHEKVNRTVEEIPGGVRTVTTSTEQEIVDQIRTHVAQMKERIEQGRAIRMMDPLFREIFRHHEKIRLDIEQLSNGVRVTETSDDPQVILLIRQHANRAVSEFVSRGMQRAMESTPLPDGYGRE